MDLARLPFPVVTVAGTNGKGSTVVLLEAMLHAAGYKVGAYTSPHLLAYNERVRLATEAVGDAELCGAFECVERTRAATSLTYFEFGTLAAVEIFRRARVDLAILRVGLGGRLDAVNVWDADIAMISAIGIDHRWLGDTRAAIGREPVSSAPADRDLCATRTRRTASPRRQRALGGMCWYTVISISRQTTERNWRSRATCRPAIPGDARGVSAL